MLAKPTKKLICCRSPHGLRGLKFVIGQIAVCWKQSQPAWAAWIEMELFERVRDAENVAARMGCVD